MNSESKKIGFVLSILCLTVIQYSCNTANAKSAVNDWYKKLTTPTKGTLVVAPTGFLISGNLKNKANTEIRLMEITDKPNPTTLDSAKTDATGNFKLKGNIKNHTLCFLVWSEMGRIFMVIDNKTNAVINITDNGATPIYAVTGKNINGISDMKNMVDAVYGFNSQFEQINREGQTLTNSPEDYSKGQQLQMRYNRLLQKRDSALKNIVLNSKKSFVPYFILSNQLIENPDLPLLKASYQSAFALDSGAVTAKAAQKVYKDLSRLAIGAEAPDFKITQPDGTPISLSSLKGKYVLLDFWASWCRPCRAENPNNVALYSKYKDKGFEIFGVSLDDDAGRWKSAISADGLTWKHGSDLLGWACKPAKLYDVHGIPATFLLDKEGKIIAKGLRGEALTAKLAELLGN